MGTLEWRAKKCKQIKHKTHRLDKAIYRSLQSQTPVVTGAKFPQKNPLQFQFCKQRAKYQSYIDGGGLSEIQGDVWQDNGKCESLATPGPAEQIDYRLWRPLGWHLVYLSNLVQEETAKCGSPQATLRKAQLTIFLPPHASKCHPLLGKECTDSLLEFLFAMLSIVFTNTQIHIKEWVHVPPPAMLSIVFTNTQIQIHKYKYTSWNECMCPHLRCYQ